MYAAAESLRDREVAEMMTRPQHGRARFFSPLDLEILIGLSEGRTQADIGAELRLEQSAISKHLRAAEKKIGVPLVRQEGRRLCLTSSGRDVVDAARSILEKYNDLENLVASWRAGAAGVVRIIACSTPGSYVMPLVVGEFLRSHPAAHIELDVRPLVQLWDIFANGSYDFAIVPGVTPPIKVKRETLYDDQLVLFSLPSHRLTRLARVTVDDLRDETIIGKFREGYWGTIFSGPDQAGFSRIRRVEMVSFEAIKRLAGSGVGIGALFESAVRQEIKEGKFVPLHYNQPKFRETFSLAYRPDLVKTPMVERFEAFMLNWFANDACRN